MAKQCEEISIPTLIDNILSQHSDARTELLKNTKRIFNSLHQANQDGLTREWAFEIVEDEICDELVELSSRRHGLHFNAANASSTYLEGTFMRTAADTMQAIAPSLWRLVTSLLDADMSRRRVDIKSDETGAGGLGKMEEMDLGEIGGDVGNSMDVDDEGEDMEMDIDGPNEAGEDESAAKGQVKTEYTKRQKRAAKRNEALLTIKAVVAISMFLQSTNARCNYLQGVLGLFFHSTSVPEKVIDTLAHAGISISISSIHQAVKKLSAEASEKLKQKVRTLHTALAYDNFDIHFKTAQPTVEHSSKFVSATSATAIPLYDTLSNPSVLRCSQYLWERDPRNPRPVEEPILIDFNDLKELHMEAHGHRKVDGSNLSPLRLRYAWHVRDILLQQVPGFEDLCLKNGKPESVNQIPLHKTEQIPFRSMNIKESTLDGNIQVVDTLLRQGGIGEPMDKHFNKSKGDVDMSEHVLLVHGDLLTKERLESVRDCRRIEETPKRRFQFVVFLPGLFHFKMGCAEGVFKAHMHPEEARIDDNSFYQHAAVLRPDETGKIISKPGFRRQHDLIFHDIWASMINCWSVEANLHNKEWTSLSEFAAAKPSWETIVKMSEEIVEKYVATTAGLNKMRQRSTSERDQMFENQILRNRDELHYVELSHAMNAGDIGRVEETFLQWIYLFRAVGKHKYAWHMLQTMFYLRKVWPPELAHLIRMNWLCNPTGQEDSFRAIDWVVERNNLYTKVIYGGSGSNRTLARILEESILIELFRECHVTVENGFHLKHRTLRHAPPNMKKTLKKLAIRFEENKPHIFQSNRTACYSVPDKVVEGIEIYQNTTALSDITGDVNERLEIEADDIGAI